MLKENFIAFYENSFKKNWALPALTDYFKQETFTYGDAAVEIAKLHLLFERCEVRKGDRVAVIGRNNPRWCISFLATITYGAIVVPILQDFNANDVHHILNHSGAVLLFTGDQHWDMIDISQADKIRGAFSLTDYRCLYGNVENKDKMHRAYIEECYKQKYPGGFTPENIAYAQCRNDEAVVLNYTSGTTGFSKGVILTGNNFAGNLVFAMRANMHFRGSRALSFLPLAHAYGCTLDFLYPLAMGTHVTLLGRIPSPKVLTEGMMRVRPAIIFCVPLIIEKMYKKQISPFLEKGITKFILKLPILDAGLYSVIRKKLMEAFGGEFKQVVIGGAPLNQEVEDFLRKIKFPFTVGYGMTECAPLISFADHSIFKPYSCGMILKGLMEVKIDSPRPDEIPGEICVRGENVMKGYYKNEQATREVLSEDGWLKTGDIGTVDSDGTIYIRGRSKSMILRANGQNIYPEEIESKLNNLPCVMESLVIEKDGKLVALVYPDYEQADAGYIADPHDLRLQMDSNLVELNKLVAPYEQVSEIILYPNEFEKTPKRSIKRYLYTI